MTHLSTYGVGAGRMISATSDDEDSRTRQRRLTAAQLSEQSRKSAAMREQLIQAERSTALNEARQLQREQERSISARRERQAALTAETVDGHATTEINSPIGRAPSPAHAIGGDETKPLEDQPPPRRSDEPPVTAADGLKDRLADRPVDKVRILTARLIDELPVWRAQGTTNALEERFDALCQSVSALRQSPEPDSREALDSLTGSLEFVQGYLEASSLSGDTRQRLLRVIDGVREDVSVIHSALAGLTPGATPTVAAAVLSSTESLRVHGLANRDRQSRAEAGAIGRPAVGADDESEAAAASGPPRTVPPTSVQQVGGAVPSQDRDMDKRRNETPVSVAVRSV